MEGDESSKLDRSSKFHWGTGKEYKLIYVHVTNSWRSIRYGINFILTSHVSTNDKKNLNMKEKVRSGIQSADNNTELLPTNQATKPQTFKPTFQRLKKKLAS